MYCLHYNIQTVSVCRSQLTDAVAHTKCYVIINILCQLVKADETAATDSSASLTYMLFMLFCLRSFRLVVLFCDAVFGLQDVSLVVRIDSLSEDMMSLFFILS